MSAIETTIQGEKFTVDSRNGSWCWGRASERRAQVERLLAL